MRFSIWTTAFCLCAGAVCPAHAQSCIQLYATQMHCTGPNNCSQTVAVNDYNWVEYGYDLGKPFYVPCCSTEFPTWTEGPGCGVPAVSRAAVAALAAQQPILAADCRGKYLAYGGQVGPFGRVKWSPRSRSTPSL